MGIDRRTFLKGLGAGIAGVGPAGLLSPRHLEAKEPVAKKEFMGVLVDTTRCVGCRSCEHGMRRSAQDAGPGYRRYIGI